MKKAKFKVLRGNEQQVERYLVLKKGKVYVPKDKKLRVEIIWLHHDILAARYRGRWNMTELVIRNYQQPEVTKDIGKYIDKHNMCQKTKNCTEVPAGNLMANEIPEKPWIYLIVNFIIKLLLVARKDVVLVVCDKLSKMAYFVITTKGTLAEGLIRLFRDNV